MWTRADIKERAREVLNKCYWKAVLVALIITFAAGGGGSSGSSGGSYNDSYNSDESYGYNDFWGEIREDEAAMEFITTLGVGFLLIFLISFLFGMAVQAFAFNPLQVSGKRFMLYTSLQPTSLDEIGFAFKNSYMNIVKVMFLRGIFTSLWTLLFIIPGIIKSYEYRMIPNILAENPGISSKEAFALSKKMMDGEKLNTFILDLSFLGWSLLGIFTCGVLNIFYVNPYIYLTEAQLYFALKQKIYGSAYGYQQQAYAYNQQNAYNQGYQVNYAQNNYGQNYTPQSHGQYNYGQQNANPQNYDQQNYAQQSYNPNYSGAYYPQGYQQNTSQSYNGQDNSQDTNQ